MKIGFGGLGVIALVCACGGKSASSIDDTVATAQPADPCAGIVLPAVTPADLKTFDVAGSDTHCVSAGTDLLGNVFVSVYTRYVVDQSVVTSAGLTLQSFHPAAFLRSGFATFDDYWHPVAHYQSYSPEGAVLNSLDIPNASLTVTQNPKGGSVVASGKCDDGVDSGADFATVAYDASTGASVWVHRYNGTGNDFDVARSLVLSPDGTKLFVTGTSDGGASSTIQLFYLDDANTLVRTAKVTGQGCMETGGSLKIVVDTAGLTLIVHPNNYQSIFGVPARRFAARWLDASGSPMTEWFDAGPLIDVGFFVQPLIGGGAAVSSDNNSWTFFPSGKSQAEPLPAILALRKAPIILNREGNLPIVLGGKAYAVASGAKGTVNAPTGEVCGQLPPLGDPSDYFYYLYFGRDGSLITLTGANRCTVSYYPRLLK